jgi:mRNA-degrading endonuclease RelE of RelBE toxin-antitoxin system
VGVEFLEASAFTRVVYSHMDEDGLRGLQARLAENPEAGALIPETGGFRKLRVEDPRRGKGKRGGLRLIYYYFEEDERIWMVTVYDKHEATDLSSEQRRAMKAAIGREKAARRARRDRQ